MMKSHSSSRSQLGCVVPARNESGHLRLVIEEVCSIEVISQIIIVEGGSSDDTWDIAQELASASPNGKIKAIKQTKSGKFNAVLDGARTLSTEKIVIWDADGTVSKEDTQRIVDTSIRTGRPVIGDRLRGKIEPGAMRKANWVGNWLFAFAWAPILKSRPRDMLCGTKIFPIEIFTELPEKFISADPYGDFALVGFARFRKLKIESVVVDYKARIYGDTNIHRWSGGIQLLNTTLRIYFFYLKIFLLRVKL